MSKMLPKMDSSCMQLERFYFFLGFINPILLAVLKFVYLLHAGLKLVILPSQFDECWDCMCSLPYQSFLVIKYVPVLMGGKDNLNYHFVHLKK